MSTLSGVMVCGYLGFTSNLFSCCSHCFGVVKPPTKGDIGNDINSLDLTFVERVSSSQSLKLY